MNDTSPILLDVVSYDDDTGTALEIGQLALGANGLLSLKNATAEFKARLQELVDLMNNKPGLHMDVAPPAGSPRFAVATRHVERGHEDFLAALQEHVRKYYEWELEELG